MIPVWITGRGVVSSAGVGVGAFWSSLTQPAPALVTPKAREGLSVPPALVFPDEFPAEEHVDRRLVRKASGLTRLALPACAEAEREAGLDPESPEREAAGVVIGTSLGSSDYYLRFYEALLRKGPKGANAVLFTEGVFNAPSGHASKLCSLRGAGHTLVGGEEAGASALLLAHDRVALGHFPAALAGGAEAYCDLALASLYHEGRVGHALRGLDAETVGPFAEGAAILWLESEETLAARGATPRARLLGGARARGSLGDPAPIVGVLERACRGAGIGLEVLDLVVASGAGGPRSAWEALGLARARERGLRAAVCAPGSHLGEGLAFGSAAASLAAVLALEHQRAPETLGEWRALEPAAPPPGTTASFTHVGVLSTSAEGAALAVVLKRP